MIDKSKDWLTKQLIEMGVAEASVIYLELLVMMLGLVIISFVTNLIVKRIIIYVIEAIIKKTKNLWDDALVDNKVFNTLSHLAPVLVIYVSTPIIFEDFPGWTPYIFRLVNAYISVILIIVVINLLDTLKHWAERSKLFKDNPLDSYFQLAKIAIYIAGGIIIISFLLNKSPLYFFSALGAMTVVLLLVFKDTILGFVASIQLAANSMIQIDDWISMPNMEQTVMS